MKMERKSGGQFKPNLGGQFKPKFTGHFAPKSGGQFDRFFQSRAPVSLERTFTFRNSEKKWSGVRIIAANMDTVGTHQRQCGL